MKGPVKGNGPRVQIGDERRIRGVALLAKGAAPASQARRSAAGVIASFCCRTMAAKVRSQSAGPSCASVLNISKITVVMAGIVLTVLNLTALNLTVRKIVVCKLTIRKLHFSDALDSHWNAPRCQV